MSIDYYDRNSAVFFAGSVHADMSADRARFLSHIQPGSAILDAGCGSGRDTLAFKNDGYAVTAFDGSAAMARLATEHTGLPVQHLQFDQIVCREAFDGIWTCASLLHVPRNILPDVMLRLARALKSPGAWYMSFKHGDTERETGHGRRFTDMTEPLLIAAILQTGLVVADLWTSVDVRASHADQRWISAIAERQRG